MFSGRIFNAKVVTPDGVLDGGGVVCDEGRIERVLAEASSGDVNIEGCYLLPGLIDVHTHPMPTDVASCESLSGLCRDFRRQGGAGFLFSTGNVRVEHLVESVRRLREYLDELGPDAGCLGVHLEGPYVAHEGRGGFRGEAITNPCELPVETLLDAGGDWVKYINVAPELPCGIEAIEKCRARGLAVSLGHTRADRDLLLAAVAAGASSVCHTFNATEIQRFREGGVLDLTLDLLAMATDELVCELICDGVHVDPMIVKALYNAKGADGIALITDSLLGGRAAHEGQTIEVGLTTYHVVAAVARNLQGELCGSTLTIPRAVKNFARMIAGAEKPESGLVEAARSGALTSARLLGIERDYGAIRPGTRAVFCVLDGKLDVREDLCWKLNGVE